MTTKSTEAQLRALFMFEATKSLPQVRVFYRQVMAAKMGDRFVRSGIKGQADCYAYVRGSGRAVEMELKAAAGRLSLEQAHWRDWCAAWGVPWLLLQARRGELPHATVARWVGELAAVI